MLNVEWGFKLNFLPRLSRESNSKAGKALCLLSELKPTCSLSSLVEQSHKILLCKISLLLCLFTSQLKFFWTAQLPRVQMKPKDILHNGWDYDSVSLPGHKWERPLQATLIFPNRLSIWGGLEATCSPDYDLISQPVFSKKMLQIWYRIKGSGGNSFVCPPWFECH